MFFFLLWFRLAATFLIGLAGTLLLRPALLPELEPEDLLLDLDYFRLNPSEPAGV
jgi:hypothetical protein